MTFLEKLNRHLSRLADRWYYLAVLSLFAAIVAVVVTDFALYLQRTFIPIACDTALIQNGIVNTLHGQWFRDTVYCGPQILAVHSSFALLLLIPFYLLFPSPDTLCVLQVWGVYSVVIPLYFLAQEILRKPLVSFLVAASLIVSPMLLQMAMAPFHLENWILAAVFWSLYFYRRNQAIGFWASMIFAFCCGELSAPIYITLGAGLWLVDDGLAWRKRYGAAAFIAGMVWLVGNMAILMPALRNSTPENSAFVNVIAIKYSDWKVDSAAGLAKAVLANPVQAIVMLLDEERWVFLFQLVGLPLVLTLFSRRGWIMLMVLPLVLWMCDQEFYLYFHGYYYQFLLIAGYLGCLQLLSQWSVETRLGLSTILLTCFLNGLFLCDVIGLYSYMKVGADPKFSAVLRGAFASIPAEAGVFGPHRYSNYLSNRTNMVMGDLREENQDFTATVEKMIGSTSVRPDQIDYIVSDIHNDQCGWREGGFHAETSARRTANLKRLVESKKWEVCWAQNDVVILRRVRP